MTTSKYCSDCGKRLRKDSQGNKCYQCRRQDERVTCRVCGCYCKSDKSRKLSLCSKHHSLVPAKLLKAPAPKLTEPKQTELPLNDKKPLSYRIKELARELLNISQEVDLLRPNDDDVVNQIKDLAQKL